MIKKSEQSFPQQISKGKASVKKGQKFENDVADLYRLLGADVTQNIEICHKKIDILAKFKVPGSSIEHGVIVECKDEKKPRNQTKLVREFKAILEDARRSGDANSVEIITRVPFGDKAKGYARESKIKLLTYKEKVAQLIDFGSYLKDLIDRFENGNPQQPSEPPLGVYYVDLGGERPTTKGTEKIAIIDEYINEWIQQNDTKKHLAILGEYGSGKTSLCQKLAHDLAIRYLRAPELTRIPILLNLREFTKTLKIETLITSFLEEECGAMNPKFRLFKAMNDAGFFLLVFDGFDEMTEKVETDTLEMNLLEIEKLAASPNSKIIITSRLEYFISEEEEKTSFGSTESIVMTRKTEYEILRIVPWSEEQIDSFLRNRVPLIEGAKQPWTYYKNQIKRIPGLSDLSRRPVLLNMIAKTLPQLVASGGIVNRSNLYETYLMGEIKLQKILERRRLLLSCSTRFSLIQQLALNFYTSKKPAISFLDARNLVMKVVKPQRNELEAYTRDFLTCSLLIRKGDEYQFSHKSFLDYLVAKILLKEIETDIPNALGQKRLESVVAGFLTELVPNKAVLWKWIQSTKSGMKEGLHYLGGNAATLLCMLDSNAFFGKDLSRTNLTGADLRLADLRNTNLSETVMRNVDLRGARFMKKDLELAILSSVTISLHILVDKNINVGTLMMPIHYIGQESLTVRVYTPFFTEPLLIGMTVQVGDYSALKILQEILLTTPKIKAISLYADEYEKLFEILPEPLRSIPKNRLFEDWW